MKNTNASKSDEEKAEIVNKMLASQKEKYNGVGYGSEIIKSKIRKTCQDKYGMNGHPGTDEAKAKARQTCLERYGSEFYSQTLEFHSTSSKKYKYDGISFDSSWELALWIYAKDHNESIIRCPCVLTYTYEDKEYKYIPDFLYNNQLIEIKGTHLLDENNNWINPYDSTNNEKVFAKQLCATQNDVIILLQKDMKKYLDYIENVYGKNYLKQFKKGVV